MSLGGVTSWELNLLSSPQTWKVKRSSGRSESAASSPPTSPFTLPLCRESSKRATWLDRRGVRWQANWCRWCRPRFLRRQSPNESAWGCRWDGTMRRRKEKKDRIVNACVAWKKKKKHVGCTLIDRGMTWSYQPSFPDLVLCCLFILLLAYLEDLFAFYFTQCMHLAPLYNCGLLLQCWYVIVCFIFTDVFLTNVFMSLAKPCI